jgi:acetyltransferase-like isoleucine patch superfamily enzyme
MKNILKKLVQIFVNQDDIRANNYTEIDMTTNIGKNSLLIGFPEARIYVGKYCDIAENFMIRPRNHKTCHANMQRKLNRDAHGFDLSENKGHVRIGNACWIGDGVKILSGVQVGNGVVIGAGSVVTKDIPSYAVVAGVPAKVLRLRFKAEIIDVLEEIKWWDWNIEKIKRNKTFFSLNLENTNENEVKKVII